MTGPVPVTVAAATKGDIGQYIDAIGTVTPQYTATITPQASGVLTSVSYREGQFVHKGDALIEIDPRPYEATLKQAEGTLERDNGILAQAQMDLKRLCFRIRARSRTIKAPWTTTRFSSAIATLHRPSPARLVYAWWTPAT